MNINDKVRINGGPLTGVIAKISTLRLGYWVVRIDQSGLLVTYGPKSLVKIEESR